MTGGEALVRVARQSSYQYEPVRAFCTCPTLKQECRPIPNPTPLTPATGGPPFAFFLGILETVAEAKRCICFRQTDYNIVSPCYSEKAWQLVECSLKDCAATGRCRNPSGAPSPSISDGPFVSEGVDRASAGRRGHRELPLPRLHQLLRHRAP